MENRQALALKFLKVRCLKSPIKKGTHRGQFGADESLFLF